MHIKSLLLIGIILAAFTVTNAVAVDGGNAGKGKHLLKRSCAGCHKRGGEAEVIKAEEKTMRQWDRFFRKAKRKHPGNTFKEISKRDKKDINQYLFDNAVDAPSEETCG